VVIAIKTCGSWTDLPLLCDHDAERPCATSPEADDHPTSAGQPPAGHQGGQPGLAARPRPRSASAARYQPAARPARRRAGEGPRQKAAGLVTCWIGVSSRSARPLMLCMNQISPIAECAPSARANPPVDPAFGRAWSRMPLAQAAFQPGCVLGVGGCIQQPRAHRKRSWDAECKKTVEREGHHGHVGDHGRTITGPQPRCRASARRRTSAGLRSDTRLEPRGRSVADDVRVSRPFFPFFFFSRLCFFFSFPHCFFFFPRVPPPLFFFCRPLLVLGGSVRSRTPGLGNWRVWRLGASTRRDGVQVEPTVGVPERHRWRGRSPAFTPPAPPAAGSKRDLESVWSND
jgi:hypothetical protein